MKILKVKTPNAYSVYVGHNILSELPRFLKKRRSKIAFIIADEKLKAPRKILLRSLRGAGWRVFEISVRAGEGLKDFKSIYPLYGKLISLGAKRDSLLIALGGGSVGDAAGFVAATYLRGISWVGIPSTLLAQVDSSVGGKTGINHSLGKNLIGAFHQPELVLCDLEILGSLSRREIVSGLGEAIKYGLIYDSQFFNFFRKNWSQALKLNPQVLEKIVYQSLRYKAMAVSNDERDVLGVREFLNFGHTFGHGLESVSQFNVFQHGEAVIWGMRFASALSFIRSKITQREFLVINDFLKSIPVPKLGSLKRKAIFKAMQTDKKFKAGKLNFVILKSIGCAMRDNGITTAELNNAWNLIGDSR